MDSYEFEEDIARKQRRWLWVKIGLATVLLLAAVVGAMVVRGVLKARAADNSYRKGAILWKKGDRVSALKYFEAASRSQTFGGATDRFLAEAYVSVGDTGKGIAKYRELLQATPQDDALRLKLSMAYLKRAEGASTDRRKPEDIASDLALAEKHVRIVLVKQPGNAAAYRTLARILRASGDMVRAEEAMRNAVRYDPKDASTLLDLVRLYRDKGDLDAAVRECRSALAESSDMRGVALELSAILLQKGKTAQAQKLLAGLTEKHPSDATARAYMAAVLLKQGSYEEAAAMADEATKLSQGRLVLAHTVKGWALLHQKRYAEAIAELEISLEANPKERAVRWGLAVAYMGMKNDEQAAVQLDALGQVMPKFAGRHAALAFLSLRANRVGEATVEAEQALADSNRNVFAQTLMAEALERKLGTGSKAIAGAAPEHSGVTEPRDKDAAKGPSSAQAGLDLEACIRAVDLAPNSAPLRYLMGLICAKRGDRASALAHFREVVRQKPGYIAARMGLAALYMDAGQWTQAEDQCKTALASQPDSPKAVYMLALAYEGQHKFDDAIKQWEVLVTQKPDSVDGKARLASAYWAAKRHRDALTALEAATQQHPTDMRLSLLLSRACLLMGKEGQAIDVLVRAARMHPDDANARLMLARLCRRQERWSEATKYFEMLRRAKPRLVQAYEVGLVYAKQGRFQQATAVYREGMDALDDKLPMLRSLMAVYLMAGNEGKAIGLGEMARMSHKDDAQVALLLANAYASDNDQKRATELVKEAMGSDSTSAASYLAMLLHPQAVSQSESARLLTELLSCISASWFRQAAAVCDRLLQDRPQNLFVLSIASRVYATLGDADRAKRLTAMARAGASSANTLNMDLVRASLRKGDREGAKRYLADALRKAPEDAGAKLMLAALHLEDGDTDSAIRQALAVRTQHPQNLQTLRLLACAYLMRGETREAEKCLRKLTEISPSAAQERRVLAKMAFAQGRWDSCIEICKELGAPNTKDFESLWLMARAYMGKQDKEMALLVVRQALKSDPFSVPALGMAGAICLSLGRPSQAEPYFKKALKINPASVLAHVGLADAAMRRKQFDEAAKHYQAILANSPRNQQAKLGLAQACMQQGNEQRARQLATEVLADNPKSVAARVFMIAMHRRRQDAAAATAALERLVVLDPTSPGAIELGLLKLAAGDADGALEVLASLTSKKPKSPKAHAATALAYQAKGDFAAAIQACDLADGAAHGPFSLLTRVSVMLSAGRTDEAERRISETKRLHDDVRAAYMEFAEKAKQRRATAPSPARACAEAAAFESVAWPSLAEPRAQAAWKAMHGNMIVADVLARCYKQRGYPERAVVLYREVIARRPRCESAHRQLGLLLASAGDTERAITCLTKAVKLNPKEAQTQTALAWLLQKQKRFQEAIGHYQSAIAASPNSVVALNNLAWLYATVEPVRLQEAMGLILKAALLAPTSPEVLQTQGWICHLRGQHPRAIEILQRAERLNPTDPMIHYRIAMAALATGEQARSITELKKALEIDPDFEEASRARQMLKKLAYEGETQAQ